MLITAFEVIDAPVIASNWLSLAGSPSPTVVNGPFFPRNCSLNHVSEIRAPRPGVSDCFRKSTPVSVERTESKPTVAVVHGAAYGGGVWAANQITDTGGSAPTGWPTVGRPLAWGTATKITTYSTATIKYDSDDTASANSTTTLAATYGCLIYDDAATTPADQGFCFLSFGGPNSVTLGTFTVVYAAAGIMTITA